MTAPEPPPPSLEMLQEQIRDFQDALLALEEQIVALQQNPPPPPPPAAAVPLPFRDRATAAEMEALRTWVERLNVEGSLTDSYAIPACWQQHPGLVEDLAALHQSWIFGVLAQQAGMTTNTGSVELGLWYTHALWPCLERLQVLSQRYQTTICTTAEHIPDTPASRV